MSDCREFLDIAARERRISLLMTRIRKLRWMRMDDEVEELIVVLNRLAPNAVVMAGTPDTD